MITIPAYPRVTAALIPREKCLFIAQRAAHKHFGLYWEFPGGKAEDGEGLEESLVREIREELCWNIRVGTLLSHVPCRRQDLRDRISSPFGVRSKAGTCAFGNTSPIDGSRPTNCTCIGSRKRIANCSLS